MLVSGNMTPPPPKKKKNGSEGIGENFYFKKNVCPIFYFMTHLFPTAQLKNRGVEAQGHKFFNIIFYLYVLLNQIRDNHIFTKD